jgi:predicted transcriptional regulator
MAKVNPEPSKNTLRFLISNVGRHGYQPSYNEMVAHFGVTKNAIVERLRGLARRGYINSSFQTNKEHEKLC